jgi:hypothetical protein
MSLKAKNIRARTNIGNGDRYLGVRVKLNKIVESAYMDAL